MGDCKMILSTNIIVFVGLSLGIVFAQTDWVDNVPDNLQFTGSVTASVTIDGIDIDVGTGDLIGAFVDEEIRGVGNPLFFTPTGTWLFATMIYSSESTGETVSFEFYDLETDQIFVLNESLPFVENMAVGNAITPFALTDVSGCTDSNACNYDDSANSDDGSCEYPSGCDNVCNSTAIVDCAGDCGGSAVLSGCDDACNSTLATDSCGVCGGDGTSCVINVDFSLADAANGGLDVYMSNTHPVTGFQFDISGMIEDGGSGGSAEAAGFDVATGPNGVMGFSMTGSSIPAGSGLLTSLSGSFDDFSACLTNLVLSVDGEGFHTYTSGDCVDTDAVADCAGDANGSAAMDDCGVCNGGNAAMDDCGVCNGGNADDLGCGCFEAGPSGCDNECGSTAELDACGVCGGWVPESYICDGSNEYGNAGWGPDCADGSDEGEQCCDTGASAYGDCSDLYGCDDVFNSDLVDDCAGECDGDGELDYCGVCDGGNMANECEDSCIAAGGLIVSMVDAYGDGWNGNVLTIGDESFTIDSGASAEGCYMGGLDVTVACGGGSWGSEVSWSISDGSANLLEGGAPFDGCLGTCEDDTAGEDCVNDDSTSDSYGDTCSSWYDAYGYPGSYGCSGGYNDDDFDAAEQCCACQGDGTFSDNDSLPLDDFDIAFSGNSLHAEEKVAEAKEYMRTQQYRIDNPIATPESNRDGDDCGGTGPDTDCFGECFGSAEDSGCGCDEPGPSGCDDTCGSTAELDDCGVCGGDNSSCTDCAGIVNGNSYVDVCGECNDDSGDDCTANQSQSQAFYYFDSVTLNGMSLESGDYILAYYNEILLGGAEWAGLNTILVVMGLDDTPFTDGYIPAGETPDIVIYDSSTGEYISSLVEYLPPFENNGIYVNLVLDIIDDCSGECGGTALEDMCGTCDSDASNDCVQDCADVWGGDAVIDTYYEDTDGDGLGAGESVDYCSIFAPVSWVTNGDDPEPNCPTNDTDDCSVCAGDNGTCCTDPGADEYLAPGICEYTYTLTLHDGANLVSFWGLPENPELSPMFTSLDGNIFGIIGESVAATLHDTLGWIGSIAEIDPLSGYWLMLDEVASFDITAVQLTPCDTIYQIIESANLISFPCDIECAIANAIPDDFGPYITGIISEGVAAAPHPLLGWVGSLTHFEGGVGYWLISDTDMLFNFDLTNCTESSSSLARINHIQSEKSYNQSSEQAFYFIEDIENIEVGDIVSAYCNDTKVGSREWVGAYTDIPAMGFDNTDLTNDYCTSSSVPTFRVEKENGVTYELTGDVPVWESNGLHMLSTLQEAIILPESYSLAPAYPNPFNPTTTINFAIPSDTEVSISVYNLQGREVVSLANDSYDAGYHSVIWNADTHSSGVYFVKMVAGSYVNTQKLMLVK